MSDKEDMKRCPFCDELVRKNAIKCRHCGSIISSDTLSFATDSQPDTLVKQVLGETYEIQGVIGSGGMAVVFKANQINLQRPVALKVIHQNLIHEKEFVDRFLREARVGASLSHENIVTIFDVGSIGTVHYMAMEYLEGRTLREIILKTGKLSVAHTVKYIVPIAEALSYLHSNDLVHRDIKTANVIITTKQRPVLTDFGIVFVRGETRLSQAGTVVGTPEYMSPEQATGKVEVDSRADIYSLGIMIYECLTGKVPFHSSNPLTTVHSLLNDKPKEPKLHVKSIPMWLNRLILDCLVKDPDDRIQDCKVIADALKNKDYKGNPAKGKKKSKSKKDAVKESYETVKISGNEVLPPIDTEDTKSGSKKKWMIPLIVFLGLIIGAFAYVYFAGPPAFLPDSLKASLSFTEKNNNAGTAQKNEKTVTVEPATKKDNSGVQNDKVDQGNAEKEAENKVVKDDGSTDVAAASEPEVKKETPTDVAENKHEENNAEAESLSQEELERLRKEEEARKQRAAEEEAARLKAAEEERKKREAAARLKAQQRTKLNSDQMTMLAGLGIELVYVKNPAGNYYIGKYEVNQDVWQTIMGNNPSINKGSNKPVENISRIDMLGFLEKLNNQTSLNFRLPSVNEWLFAARANNEFKYSGSNILSDCAWYEANTNMTSTKPVGQKAPNAFGLYDMSGNVAEMCVDGTLKGGSYLSPSNQCELSYSEKWNSGQKSWSAGFRLFLKYQRN